MDARYKAVDFFVTAFLSSPEKFNGHVDFFFFFFFLYSTNLLKQFELFWLNRL